MLFLISLDSLTYYKMHILFKKKKKKSVDNFFFFSTRAQLKCFYYPVLETGGEKRTMDTTSPLLTSNTLLQSWTWCIIFNIIKERKLYWKRYPSECGRALKYDTCKGKNLCSIIPKRDAEKRQLLQRPNPNILPTIDNFGYSPLVRRSANPKVR